MMLITKAIATKLAAADQSYVDSGETPQQVLVKFFCPWGAATWWIVQGTPIDANGEPTTADKAKDWHMFGFADMGDHRSAELGYTLLSQLTEIRGPFGLKIERDRHYNGSTLKEVCGRPEYQR